MYIRKKLLDKAIAKSCKHQKKISFQNYLCGLGSVREKKLLLLGVGFD
jgi:hypothetical protein